MSGEVRQLLPGEVYLVKFAVRGGSWNRFCCTAIEPDGDRTVFRNVQTVNPLGGNTARVQAKKVLSHNNAGYLAVPVAAPAWFNPSPAQG